MRCESNGILSLSYPGKVTFSCQQFAQHCDVHVGIVTTEPASIHASRCLVCMGEEASLNNYWLLGLHVILHIWVKIVQSDRG